MLQIIPVEYKDDLTDDLKAKVREMLVAVSQKEILSALFIFIWTQLRTPALGDQSEKPNQKLKVTKKILNRFTQLYF